MLTRRELLKGTLKAAPLLALGTSAPYFLTRTAAAAVESARSQDKILVVVELAGGNDALNMVVPFGDDQYYKLRPTLGIKPEEVLRIDESVGLNVRMQPLEKLLNSQSLAIVQGVGYPNANRSHFESMDVWHSADPTGRSRAGWLGQATAAIQVAEGQIPALHLGEGKLPLALQGAATGVPTINPGREYGLELGAEGTSNSLRPASSETTRVHRVDDGAQSKRDTQLADLGELVPEWYGAYSPAKTSASARSKLIRELTEKSSSKSTSMGQFVQRTTLETYANAERLNRLLADAKTSTNEDPRSLAGKLRLIGNMIDAGFGARIYFVSIGGFDTHGDQRRQHDDLLQQLATAFQSFFDALTEKGHAERVALMTFSEFGRRVQENSSQGTDHGAAAAMLLTGPSVRGGLVGRHPSLTDLDDGDIKYHTDFRQVYATILEDWLQCDSRRVLGGNFERLPLFRT